MADTTEIAWTDSTWNPWIGCTKISPGCDHCYAASMNDFRKWVEWGPHGTRRRTKTWRDPILWNRDAELFRKQHGHRRRVFCASLADVFDNQAPAEWRADMFALVRETPKLDWQILTKRPQNIAKMLPADWGDGYPNVWLGTTTEDQEHYDQRWPHLARIPAAVRFISYEPALGALQLFVDQPSYPDWIICGGESGDKARPMMAEWASHLYESAQELGIAFFHKQWGSYASNPIVQAGRPVVEARIRDPDRGPFANGKGGALLGGVLVREFPEERRQSRTSIGQSRLSPASA